MVRVHVAGRRKVWKSVQIAAEGKKRCHCGVKDQETDQCGQKHARLTALNTFYHLKCVH